MTATDRDRARWALRDDRKVSKFAKLVWLMLDTRGAGAWPSVATLAADCGTARSTTQKALRELEDAGWLRVTFRATQARDWDTSLYELTMPRATPEAVTPAPEWPVARAGVARATGGGSPWHGHKDQREDQTEDQLLRDQTRSSPSSLESGEPASSRAPDNGVDRFAAERYVTAYMTRRFNLGNDEAPAVVAYLQRTFRSDYHRDVAAFAMYVLRAYRAAPDLMAELADLKRESEDHEFIDEAVELLKLIRSAVRDHYLTDSERDWCRQLADCAVRDTHNVIPLAA